MSTVEIAKELTVAFINKLNIVNASEMQDVAKKIGEAYRTIYKEVEATFK